MSYNKLLGWIVAGLLSFTFLLVTAVIAEDRLGIIEHVFDFHLNEEACIQDAERANAERKDSERRHREWADDVRWSNDRSYNDQHGTTGPPDRDN